MVYDKAKVLKAVAQQLDNDEEDCKFCERPRSVVVCSNNACGRQFNNVRAKKKCSKHPQVLNSMDLGKCPGCGNTNLLEVGIDIDRVPEKISAPKACFGSGSLVGTVNGATPPLVVPNVTFDGGSPATTFSAASSFEESVSSPTIIRFNIKAPPFFAENRTQESPRHYNSEVEDTSRNGFDACSPGVSQSGPPCVNVMTPPASASTSPAAASREAGTSRRTSRIHIPPSMLKDSGRHGTDEGFPSPVDDQLKLRSISGSIDSALERNDGKSIEPPLPARGKPTAVEAAPTFCSGLETLSAVQWGQLTSNNLRSFLDHNGSSTSPATMTPPPARPMALLSECVCARKVRYVLCSVCGFYDGTSELRKYIPCAQHPQQTGGLKFCPECGVKAFDHIDEGLAS